MTKTIGRGWEKSTVLLNPVHRFLIEARLQEVKGRGIVESFSTHLFATRWTLNSLGLHRYISFKPHDNAYDGSLTVPFYS